MKTLISTLIIFLFTTTSWAVDLQNASLKEFVNQRPDLIQDIKSGKDEGAVTVSVVKDAKGRVSVWTEERRDIDSVLIGKRKNTYTYYLTDETNIITMEKYNHNNELISKKNLRHYRDGTQPDLTIINVQMSHEKISLCGKLIK